MKSYAQDDSELKNYEKTLADYVGGYRSRNVPFWVFIDDGAVVGIVVIDKEPIKLLDPIGTKVSVVLFTDFKLPGNTLNAFVSEALKMAKDHDAAYSFMDLSSEHSDLINHALSTGYRELARTLNMERKLDEDFKDVDNLRFEKIERDEADNYLSKMKEFMSGSPDVMMEIVFGNLTKLPEQFIDHWFGTEQLYYVFDEKELVGVLDLSSQYYNIANIGVSPNHRRRGYGHQIMLKGLKTLKEQGSDYSALRVHSANTGAIHLYESVGFSKDQERTALIWRK